MHHVCQKHLWAAPCVEEFKSEAPAAEEMLDRVVYAAEHSLVF